MYVKKPLSEVYYLNIFLISLMLLDAVVFDRAMYADGACAWVTAQMDESVINLFSRSAGIAIMHGFYYMLSVFVINDAILYVAWKFSYVLPFLIALLIGNLFSYKNFIIFNLLILLNILIFYMPNSMFGIGEFNVLYAWVPLIVMASLQYAKNGSTAARMIFITFMILSSKTYEGSALFSLVIVPYFLWSSFKMHRGKSAATLLADAFFVIVLILQFYYSFKYMPDWLKENAQSAVSSYLLPYSDGALWDTWLIFQCIFVASYLTLMTHVKVEYKRPLALIGFWAVLLVISSVMIFSGHLPKHSYFSKTFFIPMMFLVSLSFIFFNPPLISISLNRLAIVMYVIAAPIVIYWGMEGYGFSKYLKSVDSITASMPKNSRIKIESIKNNKFIELNKKYGWSWGSACLSYIANPAKKAFIEQPFDNEYPAAKFRTILNDQQILLD